MDVTPDSKRPSVAYFSMEYGLNHVLKIYSGGLGVLAVGKDVIQLEQRMAELAAADAARTKKHHERHAAAPEH